MLPSRCQPSLLPSPSASVLVLHPTHTGPYHTEPLDCDLENIFWLVKFVFKFPASHFMFYQKGHSARCFPLGPGDVSYIDQSVPSCLLEPFSSSLSDSFASQPVRCFSGFCVHRTEHIQLPTWSLLPAGPTFNTVNISQFNMATFLPTGSFLLPFFWLMML